MEFQPINWAVRKNAEGNDIVFNPNKGFSDEKTGYNSQTPSGNATANIRQQQQDNEQERLAKLKAQQDIDDALNNKKNISSLMMALSPSKMYTNRL